MTDQATTTTPAATHAGPRRWLLALAGLLLVLVSPVFWALALDNNVMQRTALPMWLAMAGGAGCAGMAAWHDRRRPTRVLAGITVGWVVFSIPGYLVFTRLPAPQPLGDVGDIAAVTVTDHTGQPTSLRGLLREEAVLLVFYRGHW